MKLVLISDTHLRHPKPEDMPAGDILVHAGDGTFQGKRHELEQVDGWFGKIRHLYQAILYVPGNHEREAELDPALYDILTHCNVLINQEISLYGIKFYGSPFTPEFCNWAYQLRGAEQKRACWRLIPDDTDVLITHGPPRGILDDVDGEPVGCEELLERVEQVKPRLHVFGHIHRWAGDERVVVRDGVTYVNASVCDDNYRLVNPPIILNL
jgi:Icc-related predicted phosphoesterase